MQSKSSHCSAGPTLLFMGIARAPLFWVAGEKNRQDLLRAWRKTCMIQKSKTFSIILHLNNSQMLYCIADWNSLQSNTAGNTYHEIDVTQVKAFEKVMATTSKFCMLNNTTAKICNVKEKYIEWSISPGTTDCS